MTVAFLAKAWASDQKAHGGSHVNLSNAPWLSAGCRTCSDLSDADPSPQISASEAGSGLPDVGSHRSGGAR